MSIIHNHEKELSAVAVESVGESTLEIHSIQLVRRRGRHEPRSHQSEFNMKYLTHKKDTSRKLKQFHSPRRRSTNHG